MPHYKPLKEIPVADRNRIIDGIERLRLQFETSKFPKKRTTSSLILGTWNIRNFDDDRFNYGPRTKESFYYIAEIISKFDIIAVQETCRDLAPLKKLMWLLGDRYDFIMTDITHSSIGGNDERLGFIYDKSKVRFMGIAGEIVLPPRLLISEVDTEKRQFARTPFGAQFQSGWFNFYFSTVHIFFGDNRENSTDFERRVAEIQTVADYLADEAKKSDANQILVGDFNVRNYEGEEYNALVQSGFTAVKNRKGSNRDQTMFYDQISFLSRENQLEFMEPERDDRVVQYFDSVYREQDFELYKPVMLEMIREKRQKAVTELQNTTAASKKESLEKEIRGLDKAISTGVELKKYYNEWRTFQMSDHLPLWVEIKIDFTDKYLDYLRVSDQQHNPVEEN